MGRRDERMESDMAEEHKENTPAPESKKRSAGKFLMLVVLTAAVSALVTALLVNIFERQQAAKKPCRRGVDVTENPTDPAVWGSNWPREYDGYKETAQASRTNFGGGDAH